MARRESDGEEAAPFQERVLKNALLKHIRPADISEQQEIREEPWSADEDLDLVITDLGPARRRFPRLHFSRPRRWLAGGIAAVVVGSLIAILLLLLPLHQPVPLKGTRLYSLTNVGSLSLPSWTREVDLCNGETSIQAGCRDQHLAFVDSSGHLYLWDARSGVLTRPFTFDQKTAVGVPQFWNWVLPGRYIAVFFATPTGTDSTEEIWDVVYDRQVLTVSNTQAFALSPDGNQAVVVTTQDTIQLFALNLSGPIPAAGTVPAGLVQPQAVLERTLSSPHFAHLIGLSWSPDSDQLATASSDGTVQIWEIIPEESILLHTLHLLPAGYGSPLTSVRMVWAPGEQNLATITIGLPGISLPQVWDLQTGQLRVIYNGHTAQPTEMFWLNGGEELLSFSVNEVLLWNAFTGQTLLKVPNDVSPDSQENILMAQISSNNHVLALPIDTGVQLVNLSTNKILPPIRINGALLGLSLSPDGTRLATVNGTGQVQIWDVQNQQVELTYTLPADFASGNTGVNYGINPVELAWSPNGTMLGMTYTGGTGGLVVLNIP
jgi:WD40 repeat protein